MKVLVVICRDRHTDDGITVHETRWGADQQIEKFKASYTGLTWTERDYGRSIGWVRYIESYDDGPRAHIREVDLQP